MDLNELTQNSIHDLNGKRYKVVSFFSEGYKVKDNPTVYVSVGTTLVPVADWNAFINLGGSEQSIVSLDATEFAKFNVGSSTLFKSA